MKLSDFSWLEDRAAGLTLYLVPYSQETEQLCAQIRHVFVRSMVNFGYAGYDYNFDAQFHRRSVYLATWHPKAGIVMTSRICPCMDGRASFELGLRADGTRYTRKSGEFVLDLTTYTFVRGYYEMAWQLQCAGLCRYITRLGAPRSFCLYDIENRRTERAYFEFGFTWCEEFPEAICFPSFQRTEVGKRRPVWWRIMEWLPEKIEEHTRRSASQVVADLHPLVRDKELAAGPGAR
jgi:hypothetical protein